MNQQIPSRFRGNNGKAMFAKLSRRILICLFIAVGANSSASGQETDRAALVERAKKEAEVVWYTSAGLQDSKPMADVFQKDYPFIQVSIIRAGSGVLINKILNEARAQKGLFDVLNTNDESVLPLKRRGLIARYVSPEATL
jgi:ABC-type glycerol-3-phosphate transport system substrate-binding protein